MGECIHSSVLDSRFDMRVDKINDTLGLLTLIDRQYNKVLLEQEIPLSDTNDVSEWQHIANTKVDYL